MFHLMTPSPDTTDGFAPLPQPDVPLDQERRVGVEVEFMGLSAGTAGQALAAGLGGTPVQEDPHGYLVRGTSLGDLRVELDIRYAHPRPDDPSLPVRPGPRAAALLGWLLSGLVPRELITGPLPVRQLAGVDRATAVLRAAGATGQGVAMLVGSLGLHFNVDPPDLEARTITAMLKAFVLLEPALRRATMEGVRTRRSILAAPFPKGYAQGLTAPGYWPDMTTFAADYLAANPTRDRGLDLLPILLHLDPARVRARLPYEKISGRPVLHYRLPLARVSVEGWSIAADWNRWVAIERLAADPERLAALGSAHQAFAGGDEAWARQVGGALMVAAG